MTLGIIDYSFIGFSLLFCIYSYFTGFIKRISGLIGWVLASAGMYGFIRVFGKEFFADYPFKTAICIFTVLLLFIGSKYCFLKFSKTASDTFIIGTLDKVLGFAVGLIQCIIVICIVSVLLFFVRPEQARQSVIISFIINLFHL